MTSLVTSADELLKTRTIPELRDLVYSLENDGNSKITELQVMVGSKYHDFIQSADAIAAMQQKSEFLESNLCRFLKLSQDVVSKTRDLLSRTVDSNATDTKNFIPLKLYKAVDSHDVWSFLEECDIFGAAKIIAQSKIFLNAYNISKGSTGGRFANGDASSPFRFCRFLSPTALHSLAIGCDRGYNNRSAKLLVGCSSAAFLSQTVLGDARLFLLEGSCSSLEKARTLASVGLISPEGASQYPTHRGGLLRLYLEGADVLLDSAIDGLGDRQTPVDPTNGKKPPKRRASLNSAAMGEKLVQAVLTLQQAILDIHLLFFKQVTLPPIDPALTTVPGLVILKQLEFISDVDRALSPLLTQSDTQTGAKGLGFDRAAFLADDQASSTPVDIRKVFDKWIAGAVQRVGEKARAALEAMDSATEVARLQQSVWLCCTTVTTGAPAAAFSQLVRPLQGDWEEACAELLAVKRRAIPVSDVGSAAGLLWSRVFRLPFMLQVERLLRESCLGVLKGAKGMLLQSLAQEGVIVDPVTLCASIAAPNAATRTSGSGGAVGGYSYSTLCAPSPRIFRKAEAVRCLLQEELSDLLRDITVPVQEGDPESSTGLSRALLIQCSQLSGQLAILLRCLCASLTAAIDLNTKTALAAGKASNKGGGVGGGDPNAPLLSGLLLVGRLAWLLKIRGRFLEEALSPAPLSSAPDTSSASSMLDLVSEDQMRSAFEIADTNGDGVLTYSEAVEAVNALAVSDADTHSSTSSDGTGSIPFLSLRLSPSLTFNEFALLCAHLMSPAACAPVERLKICFDDTLSAAHTQWAKRVVAVFTPSFSSGLTAELGGNVTAAKILDPSTTSNTAFTGAPHTRVASFRSTWKQVWVELDPSDSESSREQVALPTAVCTPLAAFLFSLSHCAACSLISVDTVQQLPSPDLFASSTLPLDDTDRAASVARMALFASTSLYSLAISAVADTYSTLLRVASKAPEGLGDEDVALQAVFDLMACVALEGRCGGQSKGLKLCLAGWRARLDPINAEILTPMLVTACENFSLKTHLLLPGLKQPKEAPAVVPTASSSSSLAAISSNASAISGLFPVNAASRFSLLPLPMSTHFQGSSWVDRDRERERDRERDRDRGAVEKPEESTAYAAKSLLGGLSLSQQQHNAEQLGKSLISTWGTFLGSNTDKKQGEPLTFLSNSKS